jgi:hypothetical protein
MASPPDWFDVSCIADYPVCRTCKVLTQQSSFAAPRLEAYSSVEDLIGMTIFILALVAVIAKIDSPQKTQKDKKTQKLSFSLCFLSFCVFCGESAN